MAQVKNREQTNGKIFFVFLNSSCKQQMCHKDEKLPKVFLKSM